MKRVNHLDKMKWPKDFLDLIDENAKPMLLMTLAKSGEFCFALTDDDDLEADALGGVVCFVASYMMEMTKSKEKVKNALYSVIEIGIEEEEPQ